MRLPLLLALAPGCGTLNYYGEKSAGTAVPTGETPDGEPTATDTTPDPTETPGPGPTDPGPGPGPTGTTTTETTTPGTSSTTTTTTTTTTSPPAPVPISIATIAPDYGTNAGGTVVTLTGSFDAATTFTFDGVPATLVSGSATQAVVEVPARAGVTGWVDVVAQSGARSDVVNSGFQYWEDAYGEAGAVGSLNYVDMVGGYWAAPGAVDSAAGVFAFTEGNDWRPWKDYTSLINSCSHDYVPTTTITTYDPGASYVDLVSGGASPRLVHSPMLLGTGWFLGANLTPGVDVVPGAIYDLDPVAGGPDWPGFGVGGLVQVPPPFSVTSPNLGGNNVPQVTRGGFNVNWTGGGGDYVLIWIERHILATQIMYDTVTCAVPDTGSTVIPFGVWPDWYSGDILYIQVGRVYEGAATLPHDDSDAPVAGIYWVFGAAECI